jgi:hypothetical protein
MTLSPQERERLDELDRRITAEDPAFAVGLAHGVPHPPSGYPDQESRSLATPAVIAAAAGAGAAASLAAEFYFTAVVSGTCLTAALTALITRTVGRRSRPGRDRGGDGLRADEDGGPWC